jgi:hypothetical protein
MRKIFVSMVILVLSYYTTAFDSEKHVYILLNEEMRD